jgi:hypothetical protein
LRWTIERAAAEFKIAPGTLRKSLGQSGAEPDTGGCFTTAQLVTALFDDLRTEKLATQRQLTRRYELDNSIVEASVVNKAELMKVLSAVADAMVARVMAHTELSREVREDFLRDVSSIPLILEDVAKRQSKLPRSNGQAAAGNDDDE